MGIFKRNKVAPLSASVAADGNEQNMLAANIAADETDRIEDAAANGDKEPEKGEKEKKPQPTLKNFFVRLNAPSRTRRC